MQAKDLGQSRWLLVLDRGEELVGTVSAFLEEKGIRGGFVTGIGALRNLTIAWYDLEEKEYLKRTFEENMELGSLIGSIGSLDGKPMLHPHVTVSGPELIAFTGHLVKGEVAVTAELLLTAFPVELPRREVEEVGLPLFSLEEREPEERKGGGEGAE